jgi:creatinine amidohydrolase
MSMINAPESQGQKIPSRARTSLDLLAHRTRMLPDVVWQLLTSSINFSPIDNIADRRIVVTGGGASEGPARYLAALLRNRLALRAGFLPTSAFIAPVAQAADDILIVFSQGISPNARLALRQASQFGGVVLFTGIYPEGRSPEARLVSELRQSGALIHVLPPEDESGLLVRTLGPATATLAGLLFAKSVAESLGRPWADEKLASLPDRLATARTRSAEATVGLDPDWPLRPWALVTAGDASDLCEGLRWKWMTALYSPAPPLWDVLQIAHGPLQHFYTEAMTLVALERNNNGDDARLFDRLEKVVVPGRHKLVRLRSEFAGPTAVMDHDAQCNWLLLRTLEGRQVDMSSWPGRGLDGPLYELGRDFT